MKRGVSAVLIILIVVVALAAAGFCLWYWYAHPSAPNMSQPFSGAPATGVPLTWQTFSDPQYDLSFEYPSGWYVDDSVASGSPSDIVASIPTSARYHGGILPAAATDITITRSTKGLQAAMDQDLSGENASGSAITIGGTQGMQALFSNNGGVSGLSEADMFIPHDGYTYVIILDSRNDAEAAGVYDQFVSTFAFTDAGSK